MKKVIFIILNVFIAANIFAQTHISDNFIFEGKNRFFNVYVPAIYDGSEKVPLLLNFHGMNSNKEEEEYYADFRAIADTANFIMVLPDGVYSPLIGGQAWNTFFPLGVDVNDLGFISALMDTIQARYNIDAKKIYSVGFSNGGYMSYDLACFLSNRVAAVASVSGSMVDSHKNACNPEHPTPVLHIHGTSDSIVPYDGSTPYISSMQIDSLIDFWVEKNKCSLTPDSFDLSHISVSDSCNAVHYVYSGAVDIEFYKILGGGHSWPGSAYSSSFGNTNLDFNASKEIWRFLSQYQLESVVKINEYNTKSLEVYPNPFSEQINISFVTEVSGNASVKVFDQNGQLVFSEKKNIKSGEVFFNISTSSFSSGLYFYQISHVGAMYSGKILKF